MKVMVVLAHPNPESLNHAIANEVIETLTSNGHAVIFHDLYQEAFDPNLPYQEIIGEPIDPVVLNHCQELLACEGIVVVHPNWWEQPPAILKGWIDRVLRIGVAYRFDQGRPVGLLNLKTAIVLNTSNTPEEREINYFGDPLENLWGKCTFLFCGAQNFYRRMFIGVVTSTPELRSKWLGEVIDIINDKFGKAD